MTICIGTLCEDRKCAVVASDRMLTNPALSVEFEHDEPKYEILSTRCVALTAGEALPPTELCREVISKVSELTSPKINKIANTVCEEFRKYKKKRVEEKYFKPRGLDNIEQYLQVQRHLNDNVVLRLERAIESEELSISFLIVGGDDEGSHIYEVSDPGHAECFDRVGFHAIGSGLPHAIATFISWNFTPRIDLNHATYITYEAKKHAEKAPGVGKIATDIALITNEGINFIKEEELKSLEKIYKKRISATNASIRKIEEMIEKLNLVV